METRYDSVYSKPISWSTIIIFSFFLIYLLFFFLFVMGTSPLSSSGHVAIFCLNWTQKLSSVFDIISKFYTLPEIYRPLQIIKCYVKNSIFQNFDMLYSFLRRIFWCHFYCSIAFYYKNIDKRKKCQVFFTNISCKTNCVKST